MSYQKVKGVMADGRSSRFLQVDSEGRLVIAPKTFKGLWDTKTIIGGAATANDVVSNSIAGGTPWQWSFGGKGRIEKAILTIATHALTTSVVLWLYTKYPTCKLNDNVANDGPLAADIPFLVGYIPFPAMSDSSASGISYTIATASTYGNLPLGFNANNVYGVLVNTSGDTLGGVLASIYLEAEMEG